MGSNYLIESTRYTKDEWTEIVSHFADGTIYQTWSWGAIRRGESALLHVVLKQNGEVCAAAQAWISKVPLINAGMAYVKWGPLWQLRGRAPNLDVFRRIVRGLRDELALKRGLLVRVVPNDIGVEAAVIQNTRSILREEHFECDPDAQPYQTLLLDLSPPLDVLRKKLGRKWRQHLNQADPNLIQLIEGYDDELLVKTQQIYREMVARKKFADFLDADSLRGVQKDLPPGCKIRIVVGEVGGKPVSSLCVSVVGGIAVPLVAATTGQALQTKAAHLVQWSMIERLKAQGCRWYDSGGINPERNPGSYRFKLGLAGEGATQMSFAQFDACDRWMSALAVQAGDKFIAASRAAKRWLARLGGNTRRPIPHGAAS